MPAPNIAIHDIRDERVVLDSDVAVAFGTETKRVNEARRRNPNKFSSDHAFQLTETEYEILKSQAATSKTGRGGRRYAPWAYTAKGIGRLAMILDTPEALAASDMILDTFLQVYEQLSHGHTQIAIEAPSRYNASAEDRDAVAAIRGKLLKAVQSLLDSVLRVEEQQAIKQTGKAIGTGIRDDVIERLRTKGLENEKLSVDVQRVLAEARKLNAEADGIDLDNLGKRIGMVERLMRLNRDMEPVAFIDLLDGISNEAPKRLK